MKSQVMIAFLGIVALTGSLTILLKAGYLTESKYVVCYKPDFTGVYFVDPHNRSNFP
jgi:hypothetical protein